MQRINRFDTLNLNNIICQLYSIKLNKVYVNCISIKLSETIMSQKIIFKLKKYSENTTYQNS